MFLFRFNEIDLKNRNYLSRNICRNRRHFRYHFFSLPPEAWRWQFVYRIDAKEGGKIFYVKNVNIENNNFFQVLKAIFVFRVTR
jgi:hypothetical protein